MLIESNNAQYFLKFYKLTLMNFAGKALNNASEFVPVRNKFYEKKNGKNIFFPKDADDDFRNGIKKAFYDNFIYLEKVRNGYLLRNEKQNKIYLVKAITTPLEEIIEEFSLIKTAILPFRGQIICDGLFEKHNILIGPNMMKELKEEMKLPAASGGVSSGIPPKQTRLRSMSFGAVRLAIHPCGKPQGILAEANKGKTKTQ